MGLQLLPPPPNCCQQCAVEHKPDEAHDAASLFYGFWFLQQHGRSPTWADAIAHCPPAIKTRWTFYLEKVGIDINSTKVRGDITSKEDLDRRLGKVEGDHD